jgi:hypothetical protein
VALAIFKCVLQRVLFGAGLAVRVCPTPDKQLNFIGACYV